MKNFYEKVQNGELERVLKSWLGTPFRHKCGVKGLGVDCSRFIGCVLQDLGLLDFDSIKSKLPDYAKGYHLHSKSNILFKVLTKYLDVDILDKETSLQDGDILLFNYGRTESHASFYCNEEVYHSLDNTGVKHTSVQDMKLMSRLSRILRIRS